MLRDMVNCNLTAILIAEIDILTILFV
jgi:hypothetical protein